MVKAWLAVPGTHCSKSFLVSTLSSAFILQFLAKACGLQIKMSNSHYASEHRSWALCTPQSFLLRLPALGPFKTREEDCSTYQIVLCFSFWGSMGLLQKIQKSTENFNNYSFSNYFLSTCQCWGCDRCHMNNISAIFPSLEDNHY